MSARVWQPPSGHECKLPNAADSEGCICQCDTCLGYFISKYGMFGHYWVNISKWRAERKIRKWGGR